MDAFSSSSPVHDTFPKGRFGSPSASPSISPMPSPTKTEVDADFPIEMDESFNSSMSFAFNDSPSQESPCTFLGASLLPPYSPLSKPRRNTVSYQTVFDQSPITKASSRRALGASRTFGHDLTNTSVPPNRQLFSDFKFGQPPKSTLLPARNKSKAVAPAPLKSTLSQENMGSPRPPVFARMGRRESAPTLESPARPSARSDMMDVDSPGPDRTLDEEDLGAYFEESPAPAMAANKRFTTLSSPPGSPSSSSPSNRRRGHDRAISTSGLTMFTRHTSSLSSRSNPYQRPPLPPNMNGHHSRTARNSSAPGMLRAMPFLSANDGSDDETDVDASPCVPDSRRAHILRNNAINGSPVCKPIRTSVPRVDPEVKTAAVDGSMTMANHSGLMDRSEDTRYKILPCYNVFQDGLVRITPQTLCDLLAGQYNDRIGQYKIFDCRFDFEFDAGHIDGATNLRNGSQMRQLEEILLTPGSGINEGELCLPAPSCSGDLPACKQNIIIFHCEFSRKRAPTVAAEFRKCDRKRNKDMYPRLHYPEVYVVEGGFCDFFKVSPQSCEPRAYLPMDDSRYLSRSESEMVEFERTFEQLRKLQERTLDRARSYATVEGQLSFNSLPTSLAPAIALQAGTAAQGRRGNTAVRATIAEEHEPDSSPLPCASPTPRALSMGQAPLSFAPRGFERGLQRHATSLGVIQRR